MGKQKSPQSEYVLHSGPLPLHEIFCYKQAAEEAAGRIWAENVPTTLSEKFVTTEL